MDSLFKMFSIKKLVKRCVWAIVITAIVGFLGSRGEAFLKGYQGAQAMNAKMIKKKLDCSSLGDHWEECSKVADYIPVYPVFGGLEAVWEITYLCVDQPCTDILVSVLNSFGGVLILAFLLLFLFTAAFFHFQRWYHTRKRKLKDLHINYELGVDTYAALPPSSFYHLYSPNSSVRQRTPLLEPARA